MKNQGDLSPGSNASETSERSSISKEMYQQEITG
jgi:hypothetical protein